MDYWKTHRGDEWWYSDFWCTASGSYGNNTFTIDNIKEKDGPLNARHLHELLWITFQQFKDAKVYCDLNKETKPLIEALAASGLIDWKLLQNPYSQEALLKRVEPVIYK